MLCALLSCTTPRSDHFAYLITLCVRRVPDTRAHTPTTPPGGVAFHLQLHRATTGAAPDARAYTLTYGQVDPRPLTTDFARNQGHGIFDQHGHIVL